MGVQLSGRASALCRRGERIEGLGAEMGKTQAPGSNTTHEQYIDKALRVHRAYAQAKHAGSRNDTREQSQTWPVLQPVRGFRQGLYQQLYS